MLEFLKDPQLGSFLYSLGVLCGILIRHYVYDIVRNYMIEKMKPGIIKLYLEEEMKKQAPVDGVNIPKVAPAGLDVEQSLVQGLEDGIKQTAAKE